jgi:hypothetical protein
MYLFNSGLADKLRIINVIYSLARKHGEIIYCQSIYTAIIIVDVTLQKINLMKNNSFPSPLHYVN